MMGWQVMGNTELDWLLIYSILGTATFVIVNITIFVWLLRFRPEMLRSKGTNRTETTLNWEVIGRVVLQASSFSGGIVIVINALIYMISGAWEIDARSLGVLVLAFALTLFKSIDGFITGLRHRSL
jgi:hypothetical protein